MSGASTVTPTPDQAGGRAVGHRAALVSLVLLGAALVVVIGVTTPWNPIGSVPGGRVDPQAGGDFTAAEIARADAFRSGVRPPAYVAMAVGLAVLLLLGLTSTGARLVAAVARPFGGGWWAQAVLGTLAVTLVVRLVELPFDARREQLSRDYGLSTRTWPAYAGDVVRGWALQAALYVLVVLVLLALIRRLPTMWWLPAAAGGAGLVLTVSFLYPLIVEPVFNDFRSLPQGQLRTDLLDLARRDGVPVEDVLVADASKRTTSVNAYVSGFGSTRRIVVYDTLIEQATPAEVELVVAHELGHADENDVLHGTAIGALGVSAGVCVLYLVLSSPRIRRRAGVDDLADPRVAALLLAVVAVLTTVSGPVQALVSRQIETRADLHALDLTRDPATAAAMQRRLAVTNLSDLTPPRAAYLLFASHPAPDERIAMTRDWARIAGVAEPGPLAAVD